VLRSVLDTIFPLRCAGCGDGPWPFCHPCLATVVPLGPPGCGRCGRPWEHELTRCRDCPPRTVDRARAAFLYSGSIRRALQRLKFSGWRAVAEALGEAMAGVNVFDADAVSWVPLSPGRRARRGYDQARALAAAVGRRLDLPVVPLLERVVETAPQARKGGLERRRALRGAFHPVRGTFHPSGSPAPARVLLVDDVLTTGATAAECARVLRAAGARGVGLLAAARAVLGPLPARCYPRDGSRLGLWLPGDPPR
jgi:predicted amidophosphoribosyltransferase